MTPEVLNKLIATGKAQYGTYVATGGLNVIKVPEQNGLIITGITLRAFADLQLGQLFTTLSSVAEKVWHQLRVIGKNGTNTFNTRHEIRPYSILAPASVVYLPQGSTHWDVFLNHERDVLIELTSLGRFMTGAIVVVGTLPDKITVPNNPQPPGGYGKTGVVGSLTSTETLTVAGTWQTRPYNEYTPSNPPNIDSRTQFITPTVLTTRLNPPQPGIAFGIYTMPVIEIDYVLFNKDPNITFSPPVAI